MLSLMPLRPRTAGFNSIELTTFGVQTILVYMLLMWIGGAAQSTAGGIKVNAFAVMVLNLRAILLGLRPGRSIRT